MAFTNTPQPPVDVGFMRLYSSIRPGFQAGTYQADLDQNFTGGGGASGVNVPSDMSVDTVSKFFEVTAPRFALPGTEIHSVFPPNNAVGPFHNNLPHIALKRRTLPWERAGDETRTDLPWLALVILTDGEANFIRNVDLEDALPADIYDKITERGTCDVLEVTEDVVREVFPREDEFEYLLHVREVNVNDTEYAGDDEDGFMAVVMANRLPQKGNAYGAYLITVEDRYDDLPDPDANDWVDDVGKLSVYELSPQALFEASYSRGGGANTVDLGGSAQPASTRDLTGTQALSYPTAQTDTLGAVTARRKSGWHETALTAAPATGRAPGVATEPAPAFGLSFGVVNDIDWSVIAPAVRKLRFPVLAHWTFTCTDGLDFRELMARLDVAMLGSPPRKRDTGGFPTTAHDREGFPAVTDSGHSKITHTTRGGETGVAWYRSPFTPREVKRRPVGNPFHSADQARTVGGDHIENLSEAAAFEVGRMLALADPSFLQELLRWRREGFRLLKTASLLDRFGFGGLLADGLYAVGLGRELTKNLLVDIAGAEKGLGPLIDPTLGIDLAETDAKVIADGFNQPIDRVRTALGAGKELTTPGMRIGAGPQAEITDFDALVEAGSAVLGHLRTDLEARVQDIARDAVPRDRRGGGVDRG
jgi:hypothetical protein